MTDDRRWGDSVAAMLRCHLCHREGFDVKPSILRVRIDEAPGYRYVDVPSCGDRAACRSRAELHGKPWPLLDEAPSLTLPGFGGGA